MDKHFILGFIAILASLLIGKFSGVGNNRISLFWILFCIFILVVIYIAL